MIQLFIKEVRVEIEEAYKQPFGPFSTGFIQRDNTRYIVDIEYLINGLQVNAEVAIPEKEFEGIMGTCEGLKQFLLERLFKEAKE